MQVVNAVVPNPSVAAEFFATPDDGPFVMVNLLRFRPMAEYSDGTDSHLSGREVRLPEMRAIEHHRAAGLAGQLNIRTRQR